MSKYVAFCLVMLKLAMAFANTPNSLKDEAFVEVSLSFDIYLNICPEAEAIIFSWVAKAVSEDPRMAASATSSLP